jgi:hypothetical protein
LVTATVRVPESKLVLFDKKLLAVGPPPATPGERVMMPPVLAGHTAADHVEHIAASVRDPPAH